MPLVVAPVGIVGVLPIPLVEPDASYSEPEFWYLAAIVCGVVMLIGFAVVWWPSMALEGDRFLVRGKYGWATRRALAEGERWAIAGNGLCLQRQDGTVVKLRVPKWMVNRRDWAALEQTLPTLDRY